MEPLIGVPDLADLTAAVNSHHAEIAQLRLEWAETIDKFTAWANRQAARDRVRMKKSMGEMAERAEFEDDPDVPTARSAQPMPQSGMEGIPVGAGNGHRHPKADLYARIRGGKR
jgi:hypothetical protein